MAHLHLQFGSGPNQLPAPWQNLDADHDIRKPLRFENDSAKFILAEHVIEHVQFLQGLSFLREAYRVLEVGGVLRLAFPDVVRVSHHPHLWAEAYAAHAKQEQKLTPPAVTLALCAGWGHQMAWTEGLAFLCLQAVGFRRICPVEYGKSQYPELENVDGHHKQVGPSLATLETSVIEATK